MSDSALRSAAIRLAHANPALRADLLPLLKAGSDDFDFGGPQDIFLKAAAENLNDAMAYLSKALAELRLARKSLQESNEETVDLQRSTANIYEDVLKAIKPNMARLNTLRETVIERSRSGG